MAKVLYETRRQTAFDWADSASPRVPSGREPQQFFTIPASNVASKAWEEGEYYYMVYTDKFSLQLLGYAGVENPTADQIHPTIQGALN